MKVKNLFLGMFLLAIAGLGTRCSNDRIVDASGENQSISFRVQGGTPNLRAPSTTSAYVNAFVVFGTDNVLAPSNIFNGITVTRQPGNADVFDYNPKRYYSEGATNARFAAYSPVSKKIDITGAGAGFSYSAGLIFKYEVVDPSIAGGAVGETSQEDLLVAGTTITSPSATPVSLSFTHALSRIFVKATNNLSENATIKGLTLHNLNSTGILTGAPGSPSWTWAWDDLDDVTTYSYVLAESGVAVPANTVAPGKLVTSMEQGMMVIPQETHVDDDYGIGGDEPPTITDAPINDHFALEVTYNVANLTNQKAYFYLADGYTFDVNTQYAITIAFSGTANLIEINFTIDVGTFDDDPAGTMP